MKKRGGISPFVAIIYAVATEEFPRNMDYQIWIHILRTGPTYILRKQKNGNVKFVGNGQWNTDGGEITNHLIATHIISAQGNATTIKERTNSRKERRRNVTARNWFRRRKKLLWVWKYAKPAILMGQASDMREMRRKISKNMVIRHISDHHRELGKTKDLESPYYPTAPTTTTLRRNVYGEMRPNLKGPKKQ